MHHFLRTLPALACALLAAAAFAADASPWAVGHRARARLVAGGSAEKPGGEARLAAVEIALDRGFKTYWRHPGESGLPPAFDWSGSTNLGSVEVLWPAPRRFEDAGGVSYGYEGGLVLPLRVFPKDPGRPMGLALRLEYGVCKDICIPVRAELALPLAPGAASPPPSVERALRQVPKRRAVGEGGDLAVLGVAPAAVDGRPGFSVKLRAPAGATPQLFAEGPEGWLLSAPAGAPIPVDGAPTAVTVPVTVEERPAGAAGPVSIRLTATAGDRAIETEVRLDAADLPAPSLDGAKAPR